MVLARTKTRRFDVRRHKKATDPTPAKHRNGSLPGFTS